LSLILNAENKRRTQLNRLSDTLQKIKGRVLVHNANYPILVALPKNLGACQDTGTTGNTLVGRNDNTHRVISSNVLFCFFPWWCITTREGLLFGLPIAREVLL
jgi:hypothetical protein